MGVHKNTIVINGKIYDTSTGRPVGINNAVKTDNLIRPTTSVKTNGLNKSGDSSGDEFVIKVRTQKSEQEARRKSVKRNNGVRAHKVHHKTSNASTLMRSLVRHPKNKPLPTQVVTPASQPERIVYRNGNIDRDLRASINLKSKRISKFEPKVAKVSHKTEHIPVKSAPKEAPGQKIYVTKQAPPIVMKPSQPAINKQTAKNLFETALINSNSHKSEQVVSKRKSKKAGRHIIKIASGFAVIALIGGYITYHNQTGMAVKNASAKAGFAASLPHYKPTGYKLSKDIGVEYGSVTLNYLSNTSQDRFEIKQTRTEMDEIFLENSIGEIADRYVTNVGNQKVFIYNGSNATWLKNGVLYKLNGNMNGNSPLSIKQITKIIESL